MALWTHLASQYLGSIRHLMIIQWLEEPIRTALTSVRKIGSELTSTAASTVDYFITLFLNSC
jgi:hypothetical protein